MRQAASGAMSNRLSALAELATAGRTPGLEAALGGGPSPSGGTGTAVSSQPTTPTRAAAFPHRPLTPTRPARGSLASPSAAQEVAVQEVQMNTGSASMSRSASPVDGWPSESAPSAAPGSAQDGAAGVAASAATDGKRDTPSADRARLLPRRAIEQLVSWFMTHLHNPYPSRDEHMRMVGLTGLSEAQVTNWFANVRRRNRELIMHPRVVATMVDWLRGHEEHPYPSDGDLQRLADGTGLEQEVVDRWLQKARALMWMRRRGTG